MLHRQSPLELLLLIFHDENWHLSQTLALAHVCKAWWHLVCATPTLWRQINIVSRRGKNKHAFRSTMSLLRLQLERSQGVMLDVSWDSENVQSADENSRLLHLVRCEAPFHRWRSLVIDMRTFLYVDTSDPVALDEFSNLDDLTIYNPTASFTMIHYLLERTTTNRLRSVSFVEEEEVVNISMDEIRSLYSGLLGRVRNVTLPSIDYKEQSSIGLPNNVLNLQWTFPSHHNLPHIQQYWVGGFCVDRSSILSLGNLTSLVVDREMHIEDGRNVEFRMLKECTIGGVWLEPGSSLSAPNLRIFQLSNDGPYWVDYDSTTWTNRLASPGFKMIPSKRLELGKTFQDMALPVLIKRCHTVESVSINLGNREESSQDLLSRVFGLEEGIAGEGHSASPAPSMRELRLEFGWRLKDVDVWKSWANELQDSRCESGESVSIFGSWKGEGTFIRLA